MKARFFSLALAATLIACGPVSAEKENAPTLLVGNKGDDSVSFINLKTGREEARRPTAGPAPHEIAISPDGRVAAVVHYGANGIELFDIADRSTQGIIQLPPNARPHGIVWLPDGRIVTTAEGINAIIVAQPCGPTERCRLPAYKYRPIPTGQKGSHMVAVSSDGTHAYSVNMQSGSLTKIDLIAGKALQNVPAGKEPEGVAVTPDGKEVWVSARGSDKVFVYDATSLKQLAEIAVGSFPLRLVISPDGKKAVTSDLGDGGLSVIDIASRKVERKIKVSGTRQTGQVTLLFSADGKRLYAAETGIDKIAEIDFETGKLIGRLSAGKQGDGLAIAP